MKYAVVAENVEKLVDERPDDAEFIYELLLAYGRPKATISRLKSGQINLSTVSGDVLLKKWVWFRPVSLTTESTEGCKKGSGLFIRTLGSKSCPASKLRRSAWW